MRRSGRLLLVLVALTMSFAGCLQKEVVKENNSKENIATNYTTRATSGLTAYSAVDESTWGTQSWGLGSNFVNGIGSDATFAVYSKDATKMVLEIYTSSYGVDASYTYDMKKNSDNIWRAKVATLPNGVYYAFRAWGPNWPYSSSWSRGNSEAGFISDVDSNGNRFNPNKVLYDPYTKELSHDKSNPTALNGNTAEIFASGSTLYGNLPRRDIDTGKYAPKSILLEDNTSFGVKPGIAQKDAIIYETHLRGFTEHSSSVNLSSILSGISGFSDVKSVPNAYRGTYKGAGYMANYLKDLGYTTIELLPVQETDNDGNSASQAGGNYWGYMTYGYFAPDRRYSYDKNPGGPTKEFKNMVKAFHDAGLEVYLDVVYNHTGEGGVWSDKDTAELTSFRGLDNSSYYALTTDNQYYWQSTGCGNNFDSSKNVVRNLIEDSLTYWTTKMGVDGFRFDLAPVLGRDAAPNYYFNSNATLLTDIALMTDAYNVEMIAEAWDTGTYQVGNFPNKWGEWNGRYRDAIRKFLKGDGNTSDFTSMINGDWNDFNDQGGPQKSVNFIDAHDGFTLMDLVSYNTKNNLNVSWPFGPTDGGNDTTNSWDSNGDQSLRRTRVRNFFVTQMFSRGIPMTVWGDEFGRTQNGNNNPYNVDSVATWNNYNMINTDSPDAVALTTGSYHNNYGTDYQDGKNDLFEFVSKLTKIRKYHSALRQDKYADFYLDSGNDVTYSFTKADGSYLGSDDRCVSTRIDGSAIGDDDFLVLTNMWSGWVNFNVPSASYGKKWVRVIDTASWAEQYNNIWDSWNSVTISNSYGVNPWSIVVLEEVNQ
ncbi:isoamylase [Haliovirga abyssi]|uniref:Glycogen operon protein GlgX homolog n=1 Tax=Haliovirga abyssi TaxID=2996794 RepID=A0AAU9DE58_9FUSO|nr:isoamylase [Haliovirga abyssi]BDU51640.1 glycogen operon protein GlgX homolog [Haliovirga abyssi]